jgi:TonB family protein
MKGTLCLVCIFLGLGMSMAPQQSTRDYLQHLAGQRLILRHYAGSSDPHVKENDLSKKRGGCDEAVEVTGVAFDNSAVQFKLRNIGSPIIQKKSKGCTMDLPDDYSLRVTDFELDQSRDQAETAIGYVLQTPEAYLVASGVVLKLPPPSENESPVDFPGPGLTAPQAVLSVTPYYSDANRKARIQGRVTVRCVIGTDGLVRAPVIEKGINRELNLLTLEALTFWRLEPARKGDRSIAAKVPVEISFGML